MQEMGHFRKMWKFWKKGNISLYSYRKAVIQNYFFNKVALHIYGIALWQGFFAIKFFHVILFHCICHHFVDMNVRSIFKIARDLKFEIWNLLWKKETMSFIAKIIIRKMKYPKFFGMLYMLKVVFASLTVLSKIL